MAASKTPLQLQARIMDKFIAFGAKNSDAIEFFPKERIAHFKRIRNYVTIDYDIGERLKIQFVSPKIAANFLTVLVRSFSVSDEPTFVADVKRWMRVSYMLSHEHEHEPEPEPASGASDD